jgi:hypothetical protein
MPSTNVCVWCWYEQGRGVFPGGSESSGMCQKHKQQQRAKLRNLRVLPTGLEEEVAMWQPVPTYEDALAFLQCA